MSKDFDILIGSAHVLGASFKIPPGSLKGTLISAETNPAYLLWQQLNMHRVAVLPKLKATGSLLTLSLVAESYDRAVMDLLSSILGELNTVDGLGNMIAFEPYTDGQTSYEGVHLQCRPAGKSFMVSAVVRLED